MNFGTGISWLAAAVTAVIAVMAIWRDPRSSVHRIFSTGMALLAIDAGLAGLTFRASSPDDFLFLQRIKLIAASFIPAVWLLFSVSFARTNYAEQIARWKWILALALALPLSLAILFEGEFVTGLAILQDTQSLLLRLGWSGHFWHLLWVIVSVTILMNLERTFRHATGHIRWQTKFMFLGIAGIFGVHVFTDSQAVLFKGINTGMDIVDLGALLVGDILIFRSLFRGRPLHASVYLSHQFLYNSFTALVVGIYFISVGVLAWIAVRFEWIRNIHVTIFLIFLAVIGIAAFLLSDRLRLTRKRFISRHFKRPQYDYRKIWAGFTAKTASVTQTRELCGIIARMVSETLDILSVTIWLTEERQDRLALGGSTVFPDKQPAGLGLFGERSGELIRAMEGQTLPVDLAGREDDWVADLKHSYGIEETKESKIRYCVPLHASGRLIGLMTLSEKVFYKPLSFEELELVKTLADQAAESLMNLQLSEKLRKAKELEAFQSMSAFFMHDLKNLASKLSLVTQNLPVHLDNPEFRQDAVKTITQSVSKINGMVSRLSLLSQRLELNREKADVNDLVLGVLSDLKPYITAVVVEDFHPLKAIPIDREQLHKVLENLIINANDAIAGENGQITVSTRENGQWVEISVADNGCGMSREFIEKSLFRPFQTTKKQGMGIGLYHCKTIVEAHRGRMEVDSEEGRGTVFRVLLAGNGD
jgi:putative PEP-CTERM system histidine kinase